MLKPARQACSCVDGMEYQAFLADSRTQQAVAMSVLINSEVAVQLIEHYPERLASYPAVPWLSLKGMRNCIAHGYLGIDMGVAWKTGRRALPVLIEHVMGILHKEADGPRRLG